MISCKELIESFIISGGNISCDANGCTYKNMKCNLDKLDVYSHDIKTLYKNLSSEMKTKKVNEIYYSKNESSITIKVYFSEKI
jgi:hypothetical protein